MSHFALIMDNMSQVMEEERKDEAGGVYEMEEMRQR